MLKKQHRDILLGFKYMGGCSNISDVRRFAGLRVLGGGGGDHHAKKLIDQGLMRRRSHDSYELTEDGYAAANQILAEQSA
jgi:hypothetical protein